MAKTLIQFRADETMRKNAAHVCEMLGIDLPTYFRICMSRLVKEGGIPFGLKIESDEVRKEREILRKISESAEKNGTANMTLDEINAVIDEARKSR